MDNPIIKFESWWQEALVDCPLRQKSAVCVSTIDKDGFPSGRFVDLKSANEKGFVFCTYFDSVKGKHIAHNSKTAMTIWWDHVGYQIRVVGTAEVITDVEADVFWQTRSRSAQLTTTAFDQSEPLVAEDDLKTRLQDVSTSFAEQPIPRPNNWGGYCIKPVSIEFLTFKESRLHLRELFKCKDNGWFKQLLQP
ncbi:pyridoxal 5'-phosphate synthase [Alteromonas sp. 5E99-2]|uniref:pyridoxine/pyridoxamine 5'-phosphate oxidase n=1 Tax=Alteromonas sp. 5E99-2 TaxID=2817683 RepID=UPI001A98A504|nr:pyridoxal 5'-phosphate synthase [Alteromonas sp. 5E99-2]MBO1257079.1 pyridoxal 5'-phosphate synthase [Alteromonas sp. 5E99-2]